MEADPLAGQNNALNCKDVIEVTEVLRSASLADPVQNLQHARAFAERFTEPGKTTLNNFISKITINDYCAELSMPSQINTRTQQLMAEQDVCDHSTCQDGDDKFKENCISCGDRVCTHLLDLIIVLMAATGNFGGEDVKRSREVKDKYIPTDSGNDGSDKTVNSFKAFSLLKMWRKGMKSTGLFKDTAVRNINDHKETSGGDYELSNKKDTDKENTGMKELHQRTLEETKYASKNLNEKNSNSLAERSPGGFDSSLRNTSKQCRDSNSITNKMTAHTDSTVVRSAEMGVHATRLIKKLELEKQELRKESNVLQSQIEMLIMENKNIKASLTREQTEKEIMTKKCGQLHAQLDEHKDSTRQHMFKLKSQVERLQHAKLVAEQGCLNLSLRQERLAVYEQQASLPAIDKYYQKRAGRKI